MSFDSKRYATLKNKQTSGQPLSSREFEELQRLDMQASKSPRQTVKAATPTPVVNLYDKPDNAALTTARKEHEAELKAHAEAVAGLFHSNEVDENIFVQRKKLSDATGIPYEKLRYDVRQGYVNSNANRDAQLKSVMAQLEKQIIDYLSAYAKAQALAKT